jgi:pyruvate kinase
MLRELMRLGMDVARLNFSHGTHEEHAELIARIRRAAQKEKRTICILQDLQGPKIRTGRLKNRMPVALTTGSKVVITPGDVLGTAKVIATTFPTLAREVERGARILLADGLIELRVTKVRGNDVEAEVVHGGLLGEHKGINLPGAAVNVPALSEKDREDLAFGMAQGVDAVAASFVRTAEDVRDVKAQTAAAGGRTPVIAKLEKPQAIDHLEDIFAEADGVMVARGDLGVEMAPEQVPIIQKHIIARASEWRKPVITATQMLESMMEHPRPTRAEASDVANAIFDGTDAVMLSGETASGKYPREAVAIMARILAETEAHLAAPAPQRRRERRRMNIAETICESVARAADDLEDMRAIAVFTESGASARLISKYRPRTDIYAFTAVSAVANLMNLYWGVRPVPWTHVPATEEMVAGAEAELLRRKALSKGAIFGVVAGTQKASGSTNFLRLHVAGASSVPDDKLDAAAARAARRSRSERRETERRHSRRAHSSGRRRS